MNTAIIAPYSGFVFWLALVLFVAIYGLVGGVRSAPWVRNLYMIAASFLIVGFAQPDGKSSAIPLLIVLLALTSLVYFVGRILLNGTDNSVRFKIALGAISLVILILCYFKYSYVQFYANSVWYLLVSSLARLPQSVPKHIFLLGVSYFSFKFIHFLVEVYNKRIKNLNFLTFINYTLFFPSFFVGPINRYNTFYESINVTDRGVTFSQYLDGGKRIINGLFKKMLGSQLLPFTIATLDFTDPAVSPLRAILGIYAYMFYIYFDFSGYTDMAIGTAQFVGVYLPENFNYPFLKRNLQQFWANWHMSLTTWLTDYVYWPLAKKFRHLKELKSRPVILSSLCIILTFMICGLWHGDGLNFFIWGTYHGVGLAILNIYSQFEKKHFSAKWKKIINTSSLGYCVSCFITFQYAAFGFLMFGCDMEKLKSFFQLF